MVHSSVSPLLHRINARVKRTSKGTSKMRSSISEELFRPRGCAAESDLKKSSFIVPSPRINRKSLNGTANQHVPPQYRSKHHRLYEEDNDGEAGLAIEGNQSLGRHEIRGDESLTKSDSDSESEEGDVQDWLDGSTLIAQYQDAASETEEDRAIALVEYLQVPMQEKSHELKRGLCNALATAVDDIRQGHIKVGRGADVDRGKGIVIFNDACIKRHVDVSHLQAQLKDDMADKQIEVKQLFVQLKRAYDDRRKLWVDFKARIDELTDLQVSVLDQLDDNMARTVAALEKKSKAMLRDDASKDKEKLLRSMLGKL